MTLLNVNKQTCTQCGLCAVVCPAGIIYFRNKSFPRLLPGTDEFCIRCGHCVAVCPSGSLTHRESSVEQSIVLDNRLTVSFKQCARLIMGRRSVREFQKKNVTREKIQRIIDVARYAPTGHNNQEVQWLVINDPARIKVLADIGTEWLRWTIKNNPEFAPMLGDFLKKQEEGLDMFLRDAPAVVIAFAEKNNPIAATDCVIALSYFDLAAVSAGLGCCWAGLLNFAATSFPPMIKALALPEGCAPFGSLMVGYPRLRYRLVPARKPARIIWRP